MRDAMSVIAAIVFIICGLTFLSECRADYVLQLVVGTGDDAEVIDVDKYKHRSQCEMVRNQYRLGAVVYRDALSRPILEQACVDCEEFDVCQEGI